MKTKTHNRLAAVFLALAMLLTSISFSMFASAEEAAGSAADSSGDKTYVFDATADLKDFAAGAKKDGEFEAAGTDKYFTLYYSAKTKIDGSNKKFEDGYSATQRVNFGDAIDIGTPKNAIEFTTSNPATVKVWWVQGGGKNDKGDATKDKPLRHIVIKNKNDATVATTADDPKYTNDTVNVAAVSSFSLADSGKYFIGGDIGNNYIFKIEVVEHLPKTYVFDATADLKDFAAGAKKDGEFETAGTGKYFTLYYSAKTKVDGSKKTFDDGYSATQRVNFGGTVDLSTPKNAIEFTTAGSSIVKVWWVQGGGKNDKGDSSKDAPLRHIVIKNKNGTTVATTAEDPKYTNDTVNVAAVSSFSLADSGKYFIGNDIGNNYIFKVEVVEGASLGPVERGDWSTVDNPVISKAQQEKGMINVTVSADVSNAGGDDVVVEMLDSKQNVIETKRSIAEKKEHVLEFSPSMSGTYTFRAILSRDGEESKKSTADVSCDFILPLSKPSISSATSKGGTGDNGTIEIVWTPVDEATGYTVYSDGEAVTTVKGNDNTTYIVTGLKVGADHTFNVAAVRGSETGPKSTDVIAKATEDEQRTWGYTIYGTSTNATDGSNGYKGGVNSDGKVTVFSENGKGKLESGAVDGIMFYYTAIPSDQNFILRANMHVDKWTYSNGQEAMGLLASDSVPEVMSTAPYWTNNYYLTLGTVAYNWSNGEVVYDGTGTRYDMRLGLGVYPNLGVTKENQKNIVELGLAGTVDPNIQYPLDLTAALKNLPATTTSLRYNIAANMTNSGPETIAEIEDFDVEIRKNNTGYFFTYYDKNGNVIRTQKFYDTEALSHVDEDNVYVGFFAARNARATFSNINLTVINPEDDDPAEERPITYVTPRLTITSAPVANNSKYELTMLSNVTGKAVIYADGKIVSSGEFIRAEELFSTNINISEGSNKISVIFTPDLNQDLGEYTELDPEVEEVRASIEVTYNTDYANQKNLYVSPNGSRKGNGSPEYPLDIYTAVNVVKPGQTIVIMEGTYNLYSTVRIERGIDGTASAPIRMIADPDAASRPVLDFCGSCEGIRLGGNYWYVSGFDVTNSGNSTPGFRVCGSNNTLDQINAYNNGNTGIQISAFRDSSDPRELWPSNNLILNCTSHNNADAGYEDADGFAAKITCGDGNVFDGCISYNNADDGWDLFARASSGNIGSVTIRNCVAYNNGILEDGTNAGNGNGFKLGGGNLAGGHKLINSVAFNNKADGITSNSCPDVQVINCTSYGNGKSNLNLYTGGNVSTNFVVEGFISCNGGAADIIKPNGTDTSTVDEVSKTPVTVDAFENIEFKGITRNEDGTISFVDGFLKLTDNAPAGAGSDITGDNATSTPSEDIGAIIPDENLPIPPSSGSSSSSSTPSNPSTPSTPDNGLAEFEDNGTNIEVSAPSNAFDNANEIKFNADPVVEETNDNRFTFDLSFTDKDGNKVQPKVAVTVRIPVPTALKDKTIYVYHVEDDGKYTEISCKVENGMVVFTASKFSKYIVTSEKLAAADPGNSSKPSEGTNPSTGVATPVAGLAVLMASAALTVLIMKRKRG